MQLIYKYKPIQFFLITLIATWALCPIAIYVSDQKDMQGTLLLIMLIGMLIPCAVALTMIYGSKNKALIKDFWNRLHFSKIKLSYLPVLLLLMPCVLFLATSLSLLFDGSIDQFYLSHEYRIMDGQRLFSLIILFLAPMLEELGWRGYGIDSLRSYFNLFKSTLLFALLWALWHVPVFFIQGSYHHGLLSMNIIYIINFFISILPGAILMNWLYYKNNRSIISAILFHFMLNLFSVLFQTTQLTKCIITIILCMISAIVIIKNKNFFFTDKNILQDNL